MKREITTHTGPNGERREVLREDGQGGATGIAGHVPHTARRRLDDARGIER